LRLCKPNISIYRYVCRPASNDENFVETDDDYIIEADRFIRYVYSSGDYVSEGYIEHLNAECGEYAHEYFRRNSLILSPETCRLLEVDYVESFFTWLDEFIYNLNKYETK
jgi:hypothetical protein